MKEINEFFESNIKLNNETTLKNYYLSSGIYFKGNLVNIIKYIESKRNKESNFRYLTDLQTNDNNIASIVALGRNRWKIENEGFYTQKHRTFNISHLNSRNDTAMKNHYFFIQFAHTIRQLLEQRNLLNSK